ncbi:MAG: metallophosphoesterase family protein [Gammaproteobacteria bacterium]
MHSIGIIGDPHAHPGPLAEALAVLRRERVEAIWCTGDIAGYGNDVDESIALLVQNDCQSVLGNHEIWYMEKHANDASSNVRTQHYLHSLPLVWRATVAGKRLYMVHASPPDSMMTGIRLLDQQGNVLEAEKQAWSARLRDVDYDVLIVGHTHQVFAETLGRTLVINPGSTQYNHCCAVLRLPELQVEWFALGGRAIIKSWNWGLTVRARDG